MACLNTSWRDHDERLQSVYVVLVLTSVRGGLLTIGLDLHATGDTRVGFTAGQISNVNESIVERSLDVADAENVLGVLAGLGLRGTVVDHLLFLLLVGSLLLCSGLNI